MSSPALTIRGLQYSYGTHRVVDGIDLMAESGSVLGVLGPNGAGKSTTISLAVGTRRPESGTVEIFGHDPVAEHATTSQLAGVMLQDGGLPMSSKPLQVLRHLSTLYENPVPVDELAEPLGLHDFAGRTMRRLSGGQKQRVALAAALIGRPRLVFLDEPCAGLDPQAREVVHSFIRDLADRGVAVVLTTHDLAEAEELSDEVVVIDRGRIIAQGAPEELRSASAGSRSLTIRVDSPVPAALVDRLTELGPASAQGSMISLDGAPTASQIAAACTAVAEAGLQITDIGMQRQSLSDVFFELTGRPLR
ncbi:ABC-2 type transport system ATP-binding protein [Brevibacterium iodinum ATCC 49514]|uniref:ABC-2 type transport system ATP-binding protein n=1 Tax=Brevibacterium iodinum ATCC 49514 TaxID=1255616 RepID=A0A2H1I5P9_9MICO|nr:ABC transporter ATP-binding protein [Brevibacterium iodinum]SMX70531.1 ABC-2 type transport system ATP-binding protein [Brevibacterium iodinum ATCC 49514]SUW12594.1 Daunorubicin/doxorubicin resistance ATP-binding protein DrrA [Brevibacterium iodinum]